MTSKEERLYIKAFSKGDTRAFEVLFLEYQPKVVAFINGFIKNEEEARDICQDIFLRLWNNRSSCSNIRSLEAFLYKSSKFAVYNYFDHILVNEKYIKHLLFAPRTYDDVEEQMFADELMEHIQSAIDKLPEKRRRVFEMSRKDGMTNEEIAQSLDINKRTVDNHITSALSDIRKMMKN